MNQTKIDLLKTQIANQNSLIRAQENTLMAIEVLCRSQAGLPAPTDYNKYVTNKHAANSTLNEYKNKLTDLKTALKAAETPPMLQRINHTPTASVYASQTNVAPAWPYPTPPALQPIPKAVRTEVRFG
jgi:hypothetical protein